MCAASVIDHPPCGLPRIARARESPHLHRAAGRTVNAPASAHNEHMLRLVLEEAAPEVGADRRNRDQSRPRAAAHHADGGRTARARGGHRPGHWRHHRAARPGRARALRIVRPWADAGCVCHAGLCSRQTTATRSEALPEVPTLGDFLPGFESSQWYSVGAPSGTPADVVMKLNKEINAGLADPQLKARITELGGEPMSMTPDNFRKHIADETAKWAKVIKFAGIKVK